MSPGQLESPQVYLKPGDLLVIREPRTVITVLGSCVAVTFFNARLRIAAICHAMLPRPRRFRLDDVAEQERFKYLSEAVPHMAAQFAMLGVAPSEVEVKLFGGGNVIGSKDGDHPERWLGNVNVQTARELLEAAGFNVRAANVGGDRGRKILFDDAMMGYTSLMGLMALSLGISTTGLGIIGIYLGKIFSQVQNRPTFIIKDIHGHTPPPTYAAEPRRQSEDAGCTY